MKYFRLMAFVISFIFAGCSTSAINNSTLPDNDVSEYGVSVLDVSGHPCPETASNRTILAIGTIELNPKSPVVSGHSCPETIDPETLSATFIPDREAAAHWNVTPMLMPPNCKDCITIQVLEFIPAQKYVKLKIALKNPTGLTGYDVRGIAVVPAMGVRLLNADGWTALWDDGSGVTRNPFKAFAVDWPERQIEPGTAHARVYEFTYSKFANLATGTKLVVDASWPGHCPEAYAFSSVHQSGWIDGDAGTADFTVSLTPQDWQGNISTVLIDLSEIGGGIEPMMQSGNDWQFSFSGPVVVPDAPRANIWVDVVDSASAVHAYWLFEIGVVNENPSLPVPTGINAAPGEVYVDLTWDVIDNPNVTGVNIYRRTKGGSYDFGMPLNPAPIPGEKYKDSAVYRNVMYFYVLRSVDIDGSLSPISTEVGGKPFQWGGQFMLSDYDSDMSVEPEVSIGPDGRSRVVWLDLRPGPVIDQWQYFDILEENYTPDIDLFPEDPGYSTGVPYIVVNKDNISYLYAFAAYNGGGGIIVHPFVDTLDPSKFWYFECTNGNGYVNSRGACFDLDGNFCIAYEELMPNPPRRISECVTARALTESGVTNEDIE